MLLRIRKKDWSESRRVFFSSNESGVVVFVGVKGGEDIVERRDKRAEADDCGCDLCSFSAPNSKL